MKIPWKKTFYFVMFLGSMFGFKNAFGQNDSIKNQTKTQPKRNYSISGFVYDFDNKTPLSFCNVIIYDNNNKQIKITNTDFDGAYTLSNIPYGNYIISFSFIGYKTIKLDYTTNDRKAKINIKLEPTNVILCYEMIIIDDSKPLIDPKNTTTGETIGSEDIKNIPIRR